MNVLKPIPTAKVAEQILNYKSADSFYTLPFNTVRNGNGVIKLTDRNMISVEAFEELLPAIVSGRCNSLEELYYANAFRGNKFPITVDDSQLIASMSINYAVSKAQYKYRSVWVYAGLLDKAYDYILDRIERSRELFVLGEIDESKVKHTIDSKLVYAEEEQTDEAGNIVHVRFFAKRWHLNALNDIHDSLTANKNRLHIFIGDPGTGKSYQGIKLMGDRKILVVALSNVVASSIVSRANKQGFRDYEFWSYTKFHYMISMHPDSLESFDGFILEESSMLSTTELDILAAVCDSGKDIAVLGDTAQLPGFLGFGNILEGLVKEFPDRVTELTENRRAIESKNLVSVFYNVKHNHKLIDTSKMDDVIFDRLRQIRSDGDKRLDEMLKNTAVAAWLQDVKSEANTFACAFRKDDVKDLNNLVLKNIFKIKSRLVSGNNSYRSKMDVFSELLMKGSKFEAVCTTNIKSKTEYEAFNGERFEVQAIDGRFKCISRMFDHSRTYTLNKLAANFDLGYAMTIHKLQGSEADTVLYYEPALSSFLNPTNLRYVGLSRARTKLYMAIDTSNITEFNDYLNIFEEASIIKETA